MNDPLHSAEMALDTAYEIRNRDNYSGDRAADAIYHVQRAQALATIAQAQESKRIADALISNNQIRNEMLIAMDTQNATVIRIADSLEQPTILNVDNVAIRLAELIKQIQQGEAA